MTAQQSQLTHALRSQRLNALTHEPHARLDALVKSHNPFGNRENFAKFVAAQYLFQYDLENLYRNAELANIVNDLPSRARVEQARLDLGDLNHAVPAGDETVRSATHGLGAALGWVFVSEGSKLGAAFLIKRAEALQLSDTFGARHLGEPEGGRAQGWKKFVAALDGVVLDAEQERHAEAAAIAAFNRFADHLERTFA